MAAAVASGGAQPGRFNESFNVFLVMEDICDKLKILNYEQTFCVQREFRPLTRTYFALAGKPSDQFPYFASLVAWTMKELQLNFIEWSELEDPNSVSSTILMELKKLGFACDFPASKLRHGSGDAVCLTLNFLLDMLLEAKRFRVSLPQYPRGDAADADALEAEEHSDEILPEEFVHDSDDENDASANKRSGAADAAYGAVKSAPAAPVIKSTAQAQRQSQQDAAAWAVELERVGPLLKYKASSDAKDWRTHLEQSLKHDQLLKEVVPGVGASLGKIGAELRKSIDRIAAKERVINKQFEHLGQDFREKQAKVDTLQNHVNDLTSSIAELSAELASKAEQVDRIKSQMTERNDSVTDTTPLRRVQQALADLRKEVAAMELRIGVASQALLQSTLHSAQSKARAAAGASAGGPSDAMAGVLGGSESLSNLSQVGRNRSRESGRTSQGANDSESLSEDSDDMSVGNGAGDDGEGSASGRSDDGDAPDDEDKNLDDDDF